MKFLISTILILSFTALSAQNYWAKKESGSNVDETLAVTGDNLGNTYTTGYFSSVATIDGTSKAVNGLTDIFISKISPSGATLWVVAAGGPSSDRGLSIAVDNEFNVFISGFFSGTVNFGNGIIISSNSGSQDAFVAKYSPSGTIIWAKSGGSSGNSDRANGVAVDNSGNVFITGQFTGEADFGNFTLSSLNNSIDAFIVKYDSDGNELWAKKGSGTSIDRGLSITADNQGNAYAVGQFSGTITFDIAHPNTIINAAFIIKYSAEGNEEWFRHAGGSEQSIANSITTDGTNVYITGDFGNAITFFGAGTSTLNSGYGHALFIASYSAEGALLWKQSQGSNSAVSSTGISVSDGELGIAGWHECTFESLSTLYGEATFNSLGFKDVFVMRYSTEGEFDYARNFGSPTNEIATGIHIQTDGMEVITGVYNHTIYVPLGSSDVYGLSNVTYSPNEGLTYCGDPYYGKFGVLSSDPNAAEDGFTIKAINPARSPLDMYRRFGSGCDLSIPDACIGSTATPTSYDCAEYLISCPPFSVHAVNFIPASGEIGFQSNYVWSPINTASNYSVNQPGDVSVTITSKDGCYSSFASVEVGVYEPAEKPLLSDNAVVNILSANPAPIYICPGETVDLWCQYPAEYSHYWSGPGIEASEQTYNDTVTVSQQGEYQFNVYTADGCVQFVKVKVYFHGSIPDPIDPYLGFGVAGDTVLICYPNGGLVMAMDHITDYYVPNPPYAFNWSISPSTAGIGSSGNIASLNIPESGWYVITLEITAKSSPCYDYEQTYTVTDSIYALLKPTPVVDFTMTGPLVSCPGDTITLYTSYTSGTPNYLFNVIEDFGDSIYVYGTGTYLASLTLTNEFGCSKTKTQSVYISQVATPSISMLPENGTICPGDSILLESNSPGVPFWQGPSGGMGNAESIYVNESGLYFAEITFYPGCSLVSNTVQVTEYSTPYLEANGGVICQDDSLDILVVSTSITNISWQSPFSGSDTVQTVTQPGIYTVQVTSCNIVTEISIEVIMDTNTVFIEQPDLTPACTGDSILIHALPAYYPEYNWLSGGENQELYVYENGSYQVEVVDQYQCTLLSNIIEVEFELPPPLPEFTYTPVCEGETQLVMVVTDFDVNYTTGMNGNFIQSDPVFTIPEFYGDTTIYAYLNSPYCNGETGSISISPKPFPEEPLLSSDGPVCTGTTLNLVVLNAEEDVTYQWLSPTGANFQGYDINYGISSMDDQGLYYCFANLNGCESDTSVIEISLFETRQVELPSDTNMCYRAEFVIKPTAEFTSYLWHDGSVLPEFKPLETSEIFLVATDENGCKSVDFMAINIVNCNVVIPNIFTPNGDGRNDSWIGFTEDPLFYKIIVYNRWGRVVFESNSVLNAWDGCNYKSGEFCSEGVYFYILKIHDYEGSPFEQTGTITLIRD